MDIKKLELIIEKQIQKFYQKTIMAYCSPLISNRTTQKESNSYIMILGIDKPPAELDEDEKTRWSSPQERVKFLYIDRKIYLTVDEYWNDKELDDFINKTINQKDIIEAINSKEIMVQINGVHENPRFDCCEFCTKEYKEWRQKEIFFIEKLTTKLNEIGILDFYIESLI